MAALFGSDLRTDVLVAIARLGTTFLSELARVLDRTPAEILRAVSYLEKTGVVVSSRFGSTRRVELNPRYPQRDELYRLLLSMSEGPVYAKRWRSVRKRPRVAGKPL